MRAPLVEIHAAFLIDQRLQELQFGFSERNMCCECGHSFLVVFVPAPAANTRRCQVAGMRRCGGFAAFLQPAQFSALQNLAQIEQHHQASLQFPHAGDVIQFAFLENVLRRFDFGGRNS